MVRRDDAQDRRIKAILGNQECLACDEGLIRFFDHLQANLQLPCEVIGDEDFGWEEPYILGGWNREEYERLKKTQPSYTDRFELHKLELGVVSEWMLYEDIAAYCRRSSDGREFILGTVELNATDKTSPNYQLLKDYASWFVNDR